MLVQKFGGGVLADAEGYRKVAGIIASAKPDYVVVSAAKGVTDELIALLDEARKGNDFETRLERLKEKHQALANGSVGGVEVVFSSIGRLLKGVSYTGEYSDKLYAAVVSRGEALSAAILASWLGGGYGAWPAENGIAAEGGYANARCDFERTVTPPRRSIVTGFYGVNQRGEPCLFGRGGSDYSAACVARAAGAGKLEFWKDVNGFMTADPRVVGDARLIAELSFDEAAELARFGAKILHPSALEPLNGTAARVEIKSILNPSADGTVIAANCRDGRRMAAIAGKKGIAVVSVSGDEMVQAFGIAAKILSRVAEAGIPVDVIATAQANISFTVDEKDAEKAVKALGGVGRFNVRSRSGMALVGIVGSGVKEDAGLTARALSAMAAQGVTVEMLSKGASEIDLSLVVSRDQYEAAVKSVHEEFFGRKGVEETK